MSQREFPRTIPANGHHDFAVEGSFIYLHTSDQPLKVFVRDQLITMRQGDKRRVEGGFDGFSVDNNNASDASSVFIIGDGDYVRTSVIGEVGSDLDTTADVTIATATAAQVLAANASRKAAWIESDVPVRLGDTNVSASRGLRVPAGQPTKIETTAAIHIRNDSGASATVTLAEVLQ